jgi:glucokinase
VPVVGTQPLGAGAGPVLAIDIGGTKLAAALVGADGVVLAERRTPTSADVASAEELFATLAQLTEAVMGGRRLVGVGVGCGGPMEWPAGRVSPLNIPGWRGFPLRQRLAEHFPGLPVRLHNDAVCVAAGEHWRGAGRGSRNLLGMVISTGVGGGLVLDGRLVDGGSGNAGHIGHVVVEPDGPPCVCGGQGCLEAVARGPAVLHWARKHGWAGTPRAGGQQLVSDATAGDPVATTALQRAGRAAGIAIASATALCDLEVVTIGGGLSAAGELLMAPLRDAVRRYARLDFARGVRVVRAELGQSAGLVGAAALVLAGDRYWSAD